MNNFEKNKNIIETIKNCSELFKDLQIIGNNLVFRDLNINLNNIDLESLLKDIPEITPDSLFKALSSINSKEDNITKWEIVKKENPDMKKITIFDNHNIELNKQEEFINIRTNDGQNHLFKNVIGLDIFNEYMQLKAVYGDSISPEVLAKSIEKWQLNELAVEPAEKIIADPNVNENIKNQLQTYVEMYKNRTNIEIAANIREDIIYINDKSNPENNCIITFTKDINNNLVAVEHNSNVSSETTNKEEVTDNQEKQVQETNQQNTISESVSNAGNIDYQNTQTILSDSEFSYLVSKGNYSASDYERINNYLNNIQEMSANNDPNVNTKLKIIEESITNLQLLKDNLNPDEQALIDKCNSIFEQLNKGKGHNKDQVLSYKTANRILTEDEEDNSAGYLNVISIFITVSVVLIALSILTLYIING